MSNKGQLLQDPFLNTLRREHVPVYIFAIYESKLKVLNNNAEKLNQCFLLYNQRKLKQCYIQTINNRKSCVSWRTFRRSRG